jgi:hypothetical protein
MRQRIQADRKISSRLSRLNTERIQGEARHTSRQSSNIKGLVSEEEKSRQRKRAWEKAYQSKEEKGKSLVSIGAPQIENPTQVIEHVQVLLISVRKRDTAKWPN